MIKMPLSKYLRDVSHRRHEPFLDDEQARKSASLLAAFADSTRLQILSLLAQHDGLHVTALAECFELAQPTISHHLRILRNAGIIDYRKSGLYTYYFLKPDVFGEVRNILRKVSRAEVW